MRHCMATWAQRSQVTNRVGVVCAADFGERSEMMHFTHVFAVSAECTGKVEATNEATTTVMGNASLT